MFLLSRIFSLLCFGTFSMSTQHDRNNHNPSHQNLRISHQLNSNRTVFNRNLESSTVTFISWPHARVFDGFLETGIWIAGDIETMQQYLHQDFNHLDTIQEYAFRDGIFVPIKSHSPKFHIFSAAEAISCVTDKKVYLSGDSYMVQMFIGLGEILLGEPSNEDIKDGKHRDEIFETVEKKLKKLLSQDTHVKFLYYDCHLSDFTCMNGEMIDDDSWKSADAFFPSVYIHYKGLHINDPLMVDHYGMEAAMFFKNKEEKKLTWVSGISYRKELNSSIVTMNMKAMEVAKEHQVPVLDVFTLTETCAQTNCTTDGGHKARYVNRMKAQMLLNNICKVEL